MKTTFRKSDDTIVWQWAVNNKKSLCIDNSISADRLRAIKSDGNAYIITLDGISLGSVSISNKRVLTSTLTLY